MTDDELVAGALELARTEGIFAAPEGGACVPALRKLVEAGSVKADERVVLFNTGSGIKYLDVFEKALAERRVEKKGGVLGPALRS